MRFEAALPDRSRNIRRRLPGTPARAVATLLLGALLAACSEPDFETHDGARGQYQDWQGQWLVLNYWAEWCAPCIEEIPELNRFAARHAGQARVVGVNFDNEPPDRLTQQAEKLGIEFPVVLADPGPALGLTRPRALPTTYIFDPAGSLVATLEGPQHLPDLERATGLGEPAAGDT